MGTRTSGFSLPGFTRLAPSIHVHDAQGHGYPLGHSLDSLPSSGTRPPDVIILTSWTGAEAKHVAKYTAAYSALYPGVPILVITTVLADLTLHSTRRKLQALAPAVDYLLSREAASPPGLHHPSETCHPEAYHPDIFHPDHHPHPYHNPRHPTTQTPKPPALLLHAFSEGGAHKAVLLARAYRAATRGAARLPLGALLLDSTPGRASFARATTAFVRSFPGCGGRGGSNRRDGAGGGDGGEGGRGGGNPAGGIVSKVLAPGLAVGFVGLMWLALRVRGCGGSGGVGDGGQEWEAERDGRWEEDRRDRGRAGRGDSFIEETRRALNDETLWDVRGVVRTYLFGEGDEVVSWEDVHGHGVESAVGAGGVGSLMVRFKRTEHCAHAKGVVNGAVYWAAVRRTWEMREDGGLGLRLGLGRRLSLDSLCDDGGDGW